jgi:hypothetical protein
MALSFVYLAFVSLLKLLIRCGRRVDVKDIELLVLRHQLEIPRRDVKRPKLPGVTRAACRGRPAAAARTPPRAARHAAYAVALAPRPRAAGMDLAPSEARPLADRRQNARARGATGG